MLVLWCTMSLSLLRPSRYRIFSSGTGRSVRRDYFPEQSITHLIIDLVPEQLGEGERGCVQAVADGITQLAVAIAADP